MENNDPLPPPTWTGAAADVVRLIEAYLTEAGLHQTARRLRQESGVGRVGSVWTPSQWYAATVSGDWASVLRALSTLDRPSSSRPKRPQPTPIGQRSGGQVKQDNHENGNGEDDLEDLLAAVHELIILELAEAGDWSLAYALYGLVQHDLQNSFILEVTTPASQGKKSDPRMTATTYSSPCSPTTLTRARLLEQRLAALASARQKDAQAPLPLDYYHEYVGTTTAFHSKHDHAKKEAAISSPRLLTTKAQRREALGRRLQAAIPHQPTQRLVTLLQQAIKWQTLTGQMPMFRNHHHDDDDDDDENDAHEKTAPGRARKRPKQFHLVLGEVEMEDTGDGDGSPASPNESIPHTPLATVKFGKKAVCEAALFLLDGTGLVTGSSDGLIEIWDAAQQYADLRLDLPYQRDEQLMGHDDAAITALDISRDGTMLASGDSRGLVKVWNLQTGRCLREIQAHERNTISCLAWAPSGHHVLTASHDGTCREFGLRTGRMLREFRGHGSYVVQGHYYQNLAGIRSHDAANMLWVVTASGDGTVRVWNAQTAEVLQAWQTNHGSTVGSSVVLPTLSLADAASPALVALLPLHTPPDSFIVMPRTNRAFLVDSMGVVLRVYHDNRRPVVKAEENDRKAKHIPVERLFVAGAVSASNKYLFCCSEDGCLCVFDVGTGTLEHHQPDFGMLTTRKSKEADGVPSEITALLCHPHKSILGAFSSDKNQKKGQLVIWK